jgi:hypothetical protein
MKISNTPAVSFLFHLIAHLRKARPHSDISLSAIRFNLNNAGSSSSLVDRSIAVLPFEIIHRPGDLFSSQMRDAASSNSLFKHIITPLFRLLRKTLSSKAEELKPPRLQVTTIVLTGAALLSALVVIKLVIPYFFSRPVPPDAPQPPPPQQNPLPTAPASPAVPQAKSPPPAAASPMPSLPPPSPQQDPLPTAPASPAVPQAKSPPPAAASPVPSLPPPSPQQQPLPTAPASPAVPQAKSPPPAAASPAPSLSPPSPAPAKNVPSPNRSPDISASQAEHKKDDPAAGTGLGPASAPQPLPAEVASEATAPKDETPLAAPAPIALPVPPPVEETEPIEKPPANVSPPLESIAQPPSPPSNSPSPPSQAENSPKPKSWLQRFGGALLRAVYPTRHFSKWKKYRIIQELMQNFSSTGNLPAKVVNPEASHIAASWNTLVEALQKPDKQKNADEQYRAIILALRETASLLLSADDKIKRQFEPQLKFVKQLSYYRFAGIGLFKYCRELVELVTDTELPRDLSLDTFQQTLKSLTSRLDRPDDEHSMNPISREAKKLSGTVNVAFDPLLKDNVPYLDGQLGINGQSIRILRHGVPFDHNDPYGLVAGILSLIPLVNRYVNRDSMSSEPVLNADYAAFILEAEDRGENIFQAILENGQEKVVGDESPRVRGRLKLVLIHKNFFAAALREDGPFFEREDLFSKAEKKAAKERLDHLKERFELQLLPPSTIKPDDKPLSDEQLLEKMFAQLKETGFCIPDKVIERAELRKHIKPLLQEIEDLYFPGCKEIESVPQHQAFIMLSYVHIVLFCCARLDISILEAFCKDDIDRGNAFKTILKLHFLYLTGQINPETLLNVLVNTLAAPFIVKKQAIIPSRLVLINHVLPIMQAALLRLPQPKTTIFGPTLINPFYDVFANVGQTIYPDNLDAKNIEEYLAFLEAKPIELVQFTDNIIDDTARKIQDDQSRKDLILRSAKALNLRVDGDLLKPRADATPEQIDSYYSNIPWERIISLLTLRAELSSEEAWRIASCIQLGLHTRLHEQLKATFDNPNLNLSVEIDLDAMKTSLESGISLSVEEKIACLKLDFIYKIVREDPELTPPYPVIARLKASITIPDHRTGQAQFDWSLIKA